MEVACEDETAHSEVACEDETTPLEVACAGMAPVYKPSVMHEDEKAQILAHIDELLVAQIDPANADQIVTVGQNFPHCDACAHLLSEPVIVPDCTHGRLICKMCMIRMRVNFESRYCCVECAAEFGNSDESRWVQAVIAHLTAAPLPKGQQQEALFKQAIDHAEATLEHNPDHFTASKMIQFDAQAMGWVSYYGAACQRIADQYMRHPDFGPGHPESGQALYNMLQMLLEEGDPNKHQENQMTDAASLQLPGHENKIRCFNQFEKHTTDCITIVEATVKYMIFLEKVHDTVNWPKDENGNIHLSRPNLKHTIARENTRRVKLCKELKTLQKNRPAPLKVKGAIKQKPNDKCGCGSGKKHKKCCAALQLK